MLKDMAPDACPLCARPNYFPSDHHLVPRCRGGKETKTICEDCHGAIHKTFSNKELEREYSTVDSLLAHPTFAGTVRFLSKQDPRSRTRTELTKKQKKRGRRNA